MDRVRINISYITGTTIANTVGTKEQWERKRRAMKMASSVAKAPSRMSKKVGLKDDPGVSKLEKKFS